MGIKNDSRRAKASEPPRDTGADAIPEYVFNDEVEALRGEHSLLSHHVYTPALQEYLEGMYELDSRPGTSRTH